MTREFETRFISTNASPHVPQVIIKPTPNRTHDARIDKCARHVRPSEVSARLCGQFLVGRVEARNIVQPRDHPPSSVAAVLSHLHQQVGEVFVARVNEIPENLGLGSRNVCPHFDTPVMTSTPARSAIGALSYNYDEYIEQLLDGR